MSKLVGGKRADFILVDEAKHIERIETTGTMTLEQASKLSRKKFWEEVEHQLSTALNCSVTASIAERNGNDE